MGARLVSQATIYALPNLQANKHDRARIVLLVMCHRAKDTDRNPMFFAGSSDLAQMLGFAPTDRAGERAVERALAVLVDAGLISQVGRTSARGKRRWGLNLPLLEDFKPKGTTP